jgi:DNA-directed RNA polymerase specialized sigma24 family protein
MRWGTRSANGSEDAAYPDFAVGRSGRLYRSACLLTGGDTHLAEDLVQETLGRMYVTWRRTAKVDNPAAYAQTVLVRVFLGHRRRRGSTERPTGELPDPQARTTSGPAADDPDLRLTLLRPWYW